MFNQFPGIAEGKEGQADIQVAVLGRTAELVNQKPCIADGLVVGADCQGRMEPFDLKQVVVFEMAGDIFGDLNFGQFPDDQQVNAVAVAAKGVFSLKIQNVGIIAQFALQLFSERFC